LVESVLASTTIALSRQSVGVACSGEAVEVGDAVELAASDADTATGVESVSDDPRPVTSQKTPISKVKTARRIIPRRSQ
jgi:hypothetical protein